MARTKTKITPKKTVSRPSAVSRVPSFDQSAARTGGSGSSRSRNGPSQRSANSAASAAGPNVEEQLNEEEVHLVHPAIMTRHRKLAMRTKYTLMAIDAMKERADDEEGGMVYVSNAVDMMIKFAQLDKADKSIELLEGTGTVPPSALSKGVVGSIHSINSKLPELQPLMQLSDTVELRGLAWLRTSTEHAFFSEAVPAYSKDHHDIANAVMALAKNKPEELGTNGKHLLNASNAIGTAAVLKVINDKVNTLRSTVRRIIDESMQEEVDNNLKELVRVLIDGLGMKVTLGLVERVTLMRRTACQDGCKNGTEWNKAFWDQVDGRLAYWLQNAKAGKHGDEAASLAATSYMENMLDEDASRFGEFDCPSRTVLCDIQADFAIIFSEGLDSNV
ncbi:unnamed protein product [Tilletia controversa]|uniref:Uncharacterized protein n=1 Tax=Tilletia controversa TaxID=13291 RepID=A0A8X7ML43_9BASI|nr:hypothetical protein A4X06_0g7990 [Tilletia controversa]CAD6972694.1 unnamed protein product [Tilletia controversa]